MSDQDKKIKERFERPLKYKWTEHAERNAIYNAEMTLKDCKIYVNSLPPCCDCARAIIQAGIVEVIITDDEVPERWQEECNIALEMLKECGVTVRSAERMECKCQKEEHIHTWEESPELARNHSHLCTHQYRRCDCGVIQIRDKSPKHMGWDKWYNCNKEGKRI